MKQKEFKEAKPDTSTIHSNGGLKKSKDYDRETSLLLQKQQYETMINNALKHKKIQANTTVESYPKVKAPTTIERTNQDVIYGKVRGTPYGACLQNVGGGIASTSESKKDEKILTEKWSEWREKNFDKLEFPVEGFNHIYGKEQIDIQEDYGVEAAAIAAQVGPDLEDNDVDPEAGREYGSFKTPLDAPIGSLKDKWRVLPHFLQVRSLMRQHIDSFDYFVNTEMKEIVQSPSACEIRSEHDPKFYLRYTDCWVGEPSVEEDSHATTQATPNQCRLRDLTYSAPIYVNIRYTRGRQIVIKKKVRWKKFNFEFQGK